MNLNIFDITVHDIEMALLIGMVLALVYLYLLWQTVHLLPTVKHKGLFLFISFAVRIFLLLAVMVLCSGENVGRFLTIFIGFYVVRLFVLRFTRFGAYNREEDKHLQKTMNRKKGKK